MIKRLALGLCLLGVATSNAALVANDNAGNYGGVWAGNQGFGWGGAWTFTDSANSGHFIGDSTLNAGGSLGINTGTDAWAMFANSGATAEAFRPFSGALSVGQTFSLQIDQGFQQGGSTVGFGLQNSSGQNLVEVYYIGGDAINSWKFNDAGGQQNFTPNIGFSGDGFSVSITLTSPNTYTGMFSSLGGGGSASFGGSLTSQGGGLDISQVRFFNANAGAGTSSNLFFNNMTIVPEPSSFALLAGPAILGAWFFARRRRS